MARGAVPGVVVAAAVAALAAAARPGPPVAAATSRVPAAGTACPAAPHHAELVVAGTAGTVAVCVGFSAPELSGVELVQLSGVESDLQQFGSYGDAVCQLDNEPAQVPPTCFGPTTNWVLSVSRGCGPWQWSSVGVSSLTLGDGDLAGFVYSADTRASPPGPGGDCPPVAPPATAPPTPVPTPTASPPRPPTSAPSSAGPAHPGGSQGATPARSPTPGTPAGGGSAPAPTTTAPTTATPASAIAALEAPPAAAQGSSAPPIVAGPLRRTGAAPAPAAAAGSPAWAWVLAGLVACALVAALALRIRGRRG